MQRAVHLQNRSITALNGALLARPSHLLLQCLCTWNVDLTPPHVFIQHLHMRDTHAQLWDRGEMRNYLEQSLCPMHLTW